MKFTSGDISGRSCLPRRHGSSSSRGNGGRACFRKIGSELPRSSYCRNDSRGYGSTMSTYPSSGTDYHSDTSTYDSEYESDFSTDESATFLSETYDSSTTSGSFVTDESSDFLSDTQFDSDTSTESSYSIAAAKCDVYSSADGSSYSGSDREVDSYGCTDHESSYSLANTDSSSTYVKSSEGTAVTERKANISIPNKGCLADNHSSTIDSSYSYISKSTESESSENSFLDTSSFSTDDYYSGKYHNSRHRFKPAYSSRRKWRSSTRDRSATVTVSRKYRPSTVNGQCKRGTSYCACAGGQNKKRRSG